MKKCTKCLEDKELTKFGFSKEGKNGLSPRCKSCTKIYRDSKKSSKRAYDSSYRNKIKENGKYEEYKENNQERYHKRRLDSAKMHKEYLAKKKEYRVKNKQKYMFLSCRNRAKYNNIPFNLTIEDFIIPQYCPLLEIKLELVESNNNLNSPSLDKIIPELGYIKGNTRIISRKANMMKLNCSFDELEKFSKNILKYINEHKSQIKDK